MNFDTSDFLFLQRETAERIKVQFITFEPKMLTKDKKKHKQHL